MSDPLRTDPSRAVHGMGEADRDAKIEQLLLVGLDHYFLAQHEQAINVWTRALFLDRSHARARAYIERARSALAERQRESEELLHNGVAAFNRGESDEARRLLQAAITQGAPHDEALAVLDRLNRLEPGNVLPPVSSAARREGSPTTGPPRSDRVVSRRGRVLLTLAVAAAIGAAIVVVVVAPNDWRSFFPMQPPALAAPAASLAAESSLPIPRRGETALARARLLATSGHLREALTALDLVRPTDTQKPDADRLRAEIQRQLLALAGEPSQAAPGHASAAPPATQPRQP